MSDLTLVFVLGNNCYLTHLQTLETANQKRKRGRQGNASRNDDEDASSSQQLTLTKEGKLGAAPTNVQESDMAEEARPRKRGRPTAKAEASNQPEQSQPAKKKRRLVREVPPQPLNTLEQQCTEAGPSSKKAPATSCKNVSRRGRRPSGRGGAGPAAGARSL